MKRKLSANNLLGLVVLAGLLLAAVIFLRPRPLQSFLAEPSTCLLLRSQGGQTQQIDLDAQQCAALLAALPTQRLSFSGTGQGAQLPPEEALYQLIFSGDTGEDGGLLLLGNQLLFRAHTRYRFSAQDWASLQAYLEGYF